MLLKVASFRLINIAIDFFAPTKEIETLYKMRRSKALRNKKYITKKIFIAFYSCKFQHRQKRRLSFDEPKYLPLIFVYYYNHMLGLLVIKKLYNTVGCKTN